MKTLPTTLALSLTLFSPIALADWPEWRGPGGLGHDSEATGLPAKWSETENVTWKTPVPGRGWSSPVIEGDHIWMTAAHETLASEEETKKRLEANTGSQPLTVLAEARFHAVCVHKKTGKVVHDIEILSEMGAIDVATNTIETPEEVANTLREALKYVDADKLYPCTNCGMAPLPRDIANGKLNALSKGAELVRNELLAVNVA